MNVEIITAVKKRMKEELLPRQMEKLEIVLHEVFQEQENKKEKKNLVKKFINVKRDSAVQWQQGQLTRGCPPSRCRFFWDTQRLTPPAICQCTTGKCKAFSSEVHLLNCRKSRYSTILLSNCSHQFAFVGGRGMKFCYCIIFTHQVYFL